VRNRGAYILRDADHPEVILIGTGSEVHLALAAQEILAAQKVKARVVSMPCWELFEERPDEYREAVLPSSLRAVEAGTPLRLGALRRAGWRDRRIESFWRFCAVPSVVPKTRDHSRFCRRSRPPSALQGQVMGLASAPGQLWYHRSFAVRDRVETKTVPLVFKARAGS
jgi:hypothetical protein